MSASPASARPSRRALVIALLALAWLTTPLLPATLAAAHAQLLDSSPAEGAVLAHAPGQVDLVFDEHVTLVTDSLRLFTDDGGSSVLVARSVDAVVTATLPDALPDGSYAVAYRVVSADGHPVAGAVTFRIGAGGAVDIQVPEPDVTAATWAVQLLTALHLLATLLLAGLVGFDHLVHRSVHPPDRWTRRVLAGALGVAVLAAAALPLATAAELTGAGPGTWLPAVPLDGVLVGVITAVCGTLALWATARRPVLPVVATTAAAVLALAPALVGHSRSTSPLAVMMLADGVHLLAGAFWVGGVVGLVHALSDQRATAADLRRPSDAVVQLVTRFSAAAAGTVAALTLAGALMAVLVLDRPSELLGTSYGRTLLVKVGLVAVIVAVAWWNRRSLHRLVRARGPGGWSLFRRVMRYEASLLVLVVLVTGALTTSSPRHQHPDVPPGGEVEVSDTSQGLQITGQVTPAHPGQYAFTFALAADGEPVTDSVTVRYSLPEARLGPLTATPEFDPSAGTWSADLLLAAPGTWQVQVAARTSRFEEPIILLEVPVR